MSCTSLRPVSLDDMYRLRVGDTVSVVTRDGRQAEFRITAVTPEAIAGTDHHIALADIETIRRHDVSPGKTAGLVGAILGAVAVVLVAALVAVFASGAGAMAFGG